MGYLPKIYKAYYIVYQHISNCEHDSEHYDLDIFSV